MRGMVWIVVAAGASTMLVGPAAKGARTTPHLGDTPAAAPFDASAVPRTAAARAVRSVVVVGQEQEVLCFSYELAPCENTDWGIDESTPVIRGAYINDSAWRYLPSLITKATATRTSLSYTIRSNAYWYWGGRRLPVTYNDFAYTWQQIVNPNNDIGDSSRPFYEQITGYTHTGLKQITFHWTKPYGAWKTLFPTIYPSVALAGMDFNKVWLNCICGRDGKPVSDGPFYLSSFTKSQGSTLKPNRFWYGRKPRLKTIVFKPLLTPASEVAAMRTGAVDVINPTSSFSPPFRFGPWLKPLLHVPGIVYDQVQQGGLDEHIEFQFGSKGNPLLKSVWFRRALTRGIKRPAVIAGAYGPLAVGLTPRSNLLYQPSDRTNYRPDFRIWNYNPKRALVLLKRHCMGGPSAPSTGTTAVWTCGGVKASLRYKYENTNPYRAAAFRIIRSELKQIGIELGDDGLPHNELFGANGVFSPDNDLVNFTWGWFVPDGTDQWSCGGANNYSNYCNPKVTALIQAGSNELDPKRTRDFQRADVLLAQDVPAIPLYDKPWPLFRKAKLLGVHNNPDQNFTWDIEGWHWKKSRCCLARRSG